MVSEVLVGDTALVAPGRASHLSTTERKRRRAAGGGRESHIQAGRNRLVLQPQTCGATALTLKFNTMLPVAPLSLPTTI